MSALFKKLNRLLFERCLWVTNTVTSGVLLATGDLIQQRIEMMDEQENNGYDLERSGTLSGSSALLLCVFFICLQSVLCLRLSV